MTAPKTDARTLLRWSDDAKPPRRRAQASGPVWLTLRQAAEHSGFSCRGLREHIKAGNLPAYVPLGSRVIRIDRRDLDAFITANTAR